MLTGKAMVAFVFFVLRQKHLHRVFFPPSNLEIILIYFKPSIKTSHAALAGWQGAARACARPPVCISKGAACLLCLTLQSITVFSIIYKRQ